MDYIWKDGKLIPKQEYLERDKPKILDFSHTMPPIYTGYEEAVEKWHKEVFGFRIIEDSSIPKGEIHIK